MSINFLENIREHVSKRVELMPSVNIEKKNTIDFKEIFKKSEKPVIISEIKFASPSRGKIYPGNLSHIQIASEYINAGSAALSVLAEPEYFKGSVEFIKDIRAAYPNAHILLKDFILSKKQILQGLLYGANAVLLIAAFLDEMLLKELYDYSILLGLTPIIEVHNMHELELVLEVSPAVIGINNRNLENLGISLDTARNLIKYIPNNCHVICESGIDNPSQILEMMDIGFDAFLIGSSLMQNKNPGIRLQQLISEVINEG
jgi:indole-3-glycerol phosphate synthase